MYQLDAVTMKPRHERGGIAGESCGCRCLMINDEIIIISEGLQLCFYCIKKDITKPVLICLGFFYF